MAKRIKRQGNAPQNRKLHSKHRQGVPVELFSPEIGGFNVCFRMEFLDGGSAILRFPIPGLSMSREEKVRTEVAAIRYIQEHASIPVPFILHWGSQEESRCKLRPFILMDYNKHEMDMSDALNTPGFQKEDRPVLDPNIDTYKLEMLYRQVADILLQLSELSLQKIGSLERVDDWNWEVKSRPFMMSTNELVRLGSLPRSKLPTTSLESASPYFRKLADLHIDHLMHQRNDAIRDSDDCRRKYVARHIFKKLAERQVFSSPENDKGPLRRWCDDFRPTNILINADLQIVCVVDWEFTYDARLNSLMLRHGGYFFNSRRNGNLE